MQAHTSKETSDREKAARFVVFAFFVHGREVASLLADRLSPDRREGDPEADFFSSVTATGRSIQAAIQRVVTADGVLFMANAAHMESIQVRDRVFRVLSRQVQAVRGACRHLLQDIEIRTLGFDVRTAQDAAPMLIEADRIVGSLRGGNAVQVEPIFEGDDFNPLKYADHIEDSARKLRQALDDVAEKKRLADKAMLDKRTVTDEYDRLFLHGTRGFESHCRMVGKDELADRVRASQTRPGRTVVEPDVVPEPDGDVEPALPDGEPGLPVVAEPSTDGG